MRAALIEESMTSLIDIFAVDASLNVSTDPLANEIGMTVLGGVWSNSVQPKKPTKARSK